MKEEWKDFYKHNPSKFLEMFYSIKLRPYQKVMIDIFYKKRYAKFIERYFTVMEYLKSEKCKKEDDAIRGHRLKKAILYEDEFYIDKEIVDEVLETFIRKGE